jgi:hypothetical protein
MASKGWATSIIIVVSARVACRMVGTTGRLPHNQRKSAVHNFGMEFANWRLGAGRNGARPWEPINQSYADRA